MGQENNRAKWLHLRLTDAETAQIKKAFESTTCRKLSDYARRKLLDKAITVNHRNASLDSYLEGLAQLKSELNAVGNNFNQAVKKLNTLSKIKEFEHWLVTYELDKRQLLAQIRAVNDYIKSVSEKW